MISQVALAHTTTTGLCILGTSRIRAIARRVGNSTSGYLRHCHRLHSIVSYGPNQSVSAWLPFRVPRQLDWLDSQDGGQAYYAVAY